MVLEQVAGLDRLLVAPIDQDHAFTAEADEGNLRCWRGGGGEQCRHFGTRRVRILRPAGGLADVRVCDVGAAGYFRKQRRLLGAAHDQRPAAGRRRAELEKFRAAAAGGGPLIVGCTQETPLFSEVAGSADVTYANIRETAGWSKDAHAAGPKMAALLAAAAAPAPEVPFVSLSSEGVILIYGRDEQAIEAGHLLKDHLDVTVMITPPAEVAPPRVTDFPVVKGSIRLAKGYLGAFELTVDGYALPVPSSRSALNFAAPRDGA